MRDLIEKQLYIRDYKLKKVILREIKLINILSLSDQIDKVNFIMDQIEKILYFLGIKIIFYFILFFWLCMMVYRSTNILTSFSTYVQDSEGIN